MSTNERLTNAASVVEDIEASVEQILDVLSRRRRLFALASLHGESTPVSLADLADEIASNSADDEATEASYDDEETVYISLYHVDVPKLTDAGLVAYDEDRRTVTLTAAGEKLAEAVPLPSVSSETHSNPHREREHR